VEIIRFGLLLTMTAALISVASRYNDHGSDREQAARSHQPGATQTPSAGGNSGPATSSESPSSAAPSPRPTASAPATSNGGTSGAGQGEGVATLPNTGNSTQTIELAALAMVFIAGGSLGVRISRPRPRGHSGRFDDG